MVRLWYGPRQRPRKRSDNPTRYLVWDVNGEARRGVPIGVRGFHLLCNVDTDAQSQEMVSVSQADDPDQWRNTWRALGGQPGVDEDGDVYLP